MRLKSKILAAIAAATMAGGIAATAAVPAATAATPSAGKYAIDVFNHQFGHTDLLDVYKRSTAIGTPIILFQASNEDEAEDFTVFEEGTVNDFFRAGLASAAFAEHYGCTVASFGDCTNAVNDVAVELEYDPYGVGTAECVGTSGPAVQGSKVSLQPCGVSSKTVWAVNTTDPQFALHGLDVTVASASSINFSFPQVLDYPQDANPLDKPRAQVDTEQETGFFGQDPFTGKPTGPPVDRQQWSAYLGPVH